MGCLGKEVYKTSACSLINIGVLACFWGLKVVFRESPEIIGGGGPGLKQGGPVKIFQDWSGGRWKFLNGLGGGGGAVKYFLPDKMGNIYELNTKVWFLIVTFECSMWPFLVMVHLVLSVFNHFSQLMRHLTVIQSDMVQQKTKERE